MKTLFIFLTTITFFAFTFTTSVDARTIHVKGYITKRGTYVKPYFKTAPNKIKIDNYSTKGNTNPFTGKKGYKKAY